MNIDPIQRRAALKSFMERNGLLNVSRWEQASKLSGGVVRHFLKGRSDTMEEASYLALAAGASELLGRPVSPFELKGEVAPAAPVDHTDADHIDVISTLASPVGLMTDPLPLVVYQSGSGESYGGSTLIYKEKVGEYERITRYKHARKAFCIEATNDLMYPHHVTNDLLVIDPAKSPAAKNNCVFVRDPDAEILDTVIRHLVEIKPDAWVVRELNGRPDSYELSRAEFPKAWKIVGTHTP